MRNSTYVTINTNYTATIYSLEDLKSYVKVEKLNPANFSIHKEESGNKSLTEEIKTYIASFKTISEIGDTVKITEKLILGDDKKIHEVGQKFIIRGNKYKLYFLEDVKTTRVYDISETAFNMFFDAK